MSAGHEGPCPCQGCGNPSRCGRCCGDCISYFDYDYDECTCGHDYSSHDELGACEFVGCGCGQ